ncbi:uncharacterized protein LOC103316878 [Nasonia vitripennis]|uniref:Uncharacterized protein n=1 Tax=Nasonia vitripennis TaxID=7425 RepID=A0A7M7QZG3_NASVI|nr:uncharacterized protein LOC103316878 [Nasonia vitripennis]XP_032456822.1 uncharacterized protein LOC103316878 [Nasonia vitripennis]
MRITRGRKVKKEPISKSRKTPRKPPAKRRAKPSTKPKTTRGRKIKEEPIFDDYAAEPSDPLQPAIADAVPSTSSGCSAKSNSPPREDNDIIEEADSDNESLESSSYVSLELAIGIVPDFDSTDEDLLPFLRECKAAESFVRPEQRHFFTLLVRSKITGFARDLIDLYGKNPDTLDELIAALKSCFPFVFDVNKAFSDLWSQPQQQKHESVEIFAARISRILDRGIEAANEKTDAAKAVEVKAALDRVAASQFKNGLRDMANAIDNVPFKDAVSFAIRMASMLRRCNDQVKLEQEQLAGLSSANTKRLPNNKFAPYNKAFCSHCRKRGHITKHCWSK